MSSPYGCVVKITPADYIPWELSTTGDWPKKWQTKYRKKASETKMPYNIFITLSSIVAGTSNLSNFLFINNQALLKHFSRYEYPAKYRSPFLDHLLSYLDYALLKYPYKYFQLLVLMPRLRYQHKVS